MSRSVELAKLLGLRLGPGRARNWGLREQFGGGGGGTTLGTSSSLTGLFLQVVAFLAMVLGTHTLSLRSPRDCHHWPSCCPSKGQEFPEEWMQWNPVPVQPPEPTSIAYHSESCRASEDGPLSSRAISPWRYELDRDLNRLPQDLYHARCLCPHCVSLKTGSHMDPLGNSELLYHNQTVFYRRPCHGERDTHKGYCLERRLYRVSLACVCVRPRVMA
ncbi:interleukin-25 [Tupaia chinensis]|uniref:interleukin-25 n=1 Tax=Tupaia chinensis TaxID=246437 RepID=UPI000FFB429E|nr:interleukin-25 [Tupaia chinensis]